MVDIDYDDYKENHEYYRNSVDWGTYGKCGTQPYKRVTVAEMTEAHLINVLEGENISPDMRAVMTNELHHRGVVYEGKPLPTMSPEYVAATLALIKKTIG